MANLKEYIDSYKGLHKGIYALFFARIISNLGAFVAPFLTMLLTYKVGLDIAVVGTLVSINAGLSMVGSIIGGKIIDEFGRKKIIIIFRTFSAFLYIACILITSNYLLVTILMFSSFIDGISKPVYDTIIMDLTDEEERKIAFSMSYMGLNIGFAIGPLLAGFLYQNHIEWLFLGDALTTLISVFLIAIYVPETFSKINKNSKAKFKKNESTYNVFIKNKILLIFSVVICMYFMIFSQFHFGLSLQAVEVFGDKGPKFYGLVMAINAIICSFGTVIVTGFTNKYKSSFNIALGGMFYTIGFGMICFVNGINGLIISTFIWTIGEILVATNTSVFIGKHAPETHRGRFNSLFPIIRKIGSISGGIIAGMIVKYFNLFALWIFMSIIAAIGGFIMYKIYINDNLKDKIELKSA